MTEYDVVINGCSFTRYFWVTWADILVHSNPSLEVLNLAKPAIGNRRISMRLNECRLREIITPRAMNFVVWTSWHREDRYVNDEWCNQGNVFNAKDFGSKFVNKYWSEEYDIINNCDAIINTNHGMNIDFNGSMLRIGNTESYRGDMIPTGTSYQEVFSKFDFYSKSLPEFQYFDFAKNSKFGNKCDDAHPDILCHLDYYERLRTKFPQLNAPDYSYFEDIQAHIEGNIHIGMKSKKLHSHILSLMEDKWPGWKSYIGYHDGKWNDPIDIVT